MHVLNLPFVLGQREVDPAFVALMKVISSLSLEVNNQQNPAGARMYLNHSLIKAGNGVPVKADGSLLL